LARALIVACGCRGRLLGQRLAGEGWTVRGTSRAEGGLAEIEAAGLEPARADPDRPGTLLDLVADVTAIHWLLGSAIGEPAAIAALHGPRLERLLERLVETPVRGFVYEAAGTVPGSHLRGGEEIARKAAERWRIPVEVVDCDPRDRAAWLAGMLTATRSLIA
jgi:uncharacterized protein YbjT (DUF2867 family)